MEKIDGTDFQIPLAVFISTPPTSNRTHSTSELKVHNRATGQIMTIAAVIVASCCRAAH
ncbi:hypothetical protein [Pseudomonas sp. PS02303]|uniref:hypothetical protein n=1 Tax=Pseudomonas sp. PS02303 TaxID=2991429 RepID=UPI00249ABEF8|nr:hypothetical protein [Pseudomonas sp. PS02303]